jgi:transcriptional regulator with XRE-family HTH domain
MEGVLYIPNKAKEAIKGLGSNIRIARKRRQWTIADLAQKMNVSSPTVMALEKGEPTVSLAVLLSALWTLGLEKELVQLSQPSDEEGIRLMTARLPKKIKVSKRKLNNDF